MLDPLFYLRCNCGKIYWKQIFPLLQYSVGSPPYTSSSLFFYLTSILDLFILLTLPHPHSYIQLPFLTYLFFLRFLILILISNFHSWLIYLPYASSSSFLYPTSILDLFIFLTLPRPYSYIQLPFLS